MSHTNTDVNPNAVFNDSNANLRPRFENNGQVTAGAFTVNGVSVAVNANDSINTVLARITASTAGVTASFANDRVTLTSTTNSEDAVVLANDTSGFLSAVKLSGATTTVGNVRDDEQVLAKTTQFGSVTTGSFSLNGVSIAVNRDTDTLASIVSRINGSAAGVTASYDSTLDRLVLTGTAQQRGPDHRQRRHHRLPDGGEARLRQHRARQHPGRPAGAVEDQPVRGRGVRLVLHQRHGHRRRRRHRFAERDHHPDQRRRRRRHRRVRHGRRQAGADAHQQQQGTDHRRRRFERACSAAAHLATGNTVRGHVAEDTVALRDLSRFASVVDGSFVVGSTTIAVADDRYDPLDRRPDQRRRRRRDRGVRRHRQHAHV